MTTVERVLTLKQIDLLETAGPRQLLALAELVREAKRAGVGLDELTGVLKEKYT